MTPEQRAATVYALVNLHNIDPDNLAAQLEADGVTIATLTAECDAAQAEIARLNNELRATVAERNRAQKDCELIAASVTPDTIALPRAEVEALMEAADVIARMLRQCTFQTIFIKGQYLDRAEEVSNVRTALAALQERMK